MSQAVPRSDGHARVIRGEPHDHLSAGRDRHRRLPLVLITLLAVTAMSLVHSTVANSKGIRTYVLIEGSAAGTWLFADEDTLEVPKGIWNDTTAASGKIVAAEPGCPGEHYHGTLFTPAQPDPDPHGCGWGRVIKRRDASGVLDDVGLAVMDELRARNANHSRDYDEAKRAIGRSLHFLNQVKKTLNKNAYESQLGADASTAKVRVDSAMDYDTKAKGHNGDPELQKTFDDEIAAGLSDKVEIIDLLRKHDLVLHKNK